MARPVCFELRVALAHTPEQIGAAILDTDQWPMFTGWGPLPGIRRAEFDRRTDEIVGTRIRVTNTDGSRHAETITEWDLPRSIALTLDEFSAPLRWLATQFEERWEFEAGSRETQALRRFAMHPRWRLARPALWCIRPMLRAAVRRHMATLAGDTTRR